MSILISIIIMLLLFIAWTDWQTDCMPDQLILTVFFLTVFVRLIDSTSAFPFILSSILLFLSALVLRLVLIMLGKDISGMSDIKLLPILGLGIRPEEISTFLIWVGAVGLSAHCIKSDEGLLPVGPALIIAFLILFIPKYHY